MVAGGRAQAAQGFALLLTVVDKVLDVRVLTNAGR